MRDARSLIVRALTAVRRFPRSVAARRIGVALAIVTVSLAGVVLGVLLGGRADTDVGPFRADMSVSPSLRGGTEVVIPPLGSLTLDSHDGPVHLQIRLGALDQGRTQALIDDPAGITRASRTAVEDVRAGLVRLGVRTLAVSILGALLLSALVFRDVRRTAWSGGLALVIAAASIGVAAGTLRPRSIEEPRYEGLLVNAPAIVGDARRIADDYGRYADQLQRMVANVSRIYGTVSTLPIYEPSEDGARILHVSDLHLNPSVWPMIRSVVEQFQIDAVVDTGDIVDWGSSAETTFVSTIGQLGVPYVYIRGNHDSAVTAAAVGSPAQRGGARRQDRGGRGAADRRHRRPPLHAGQGDLTDRVGPVPAGDRAGVRGRLAPGRHGARVRAAGRHLPGARSRVGDRAERCVPDRAGRAHARARGADAAADARRSPEPAHGRGLDRRRRAARARGRGAAPRWRCRCSTSTTSTRCRRTTTSRSAAPARRR